VRWRIHPGWASTLSGFSPLQKLKSIFHFVLKTCKQYSHKGGRFVRAAFFCAQLRNPQNPATVVQ
jgi:hypothetical protein